MVTGLENPQSRSKNLADCKYYMFRTLNTAFPTPQCGTNNDKSICLSGFFMNYFYVLEHLLHTSYPIWVSSCL